tara:strand:+ start:23 stop:184 length:162 start_codon:yes stop_codon:yes gene_type:complete
MMMAGWEKPFSLSSSWVGSFGDTVQTWHGYGQELKIVLKKRREKSPGFKTLRK